MKNNCLVFLGGFDFGMHLCSVKSWQNVARNVPGGNRILNFL